MLAPLGDRHASGCETHAAATVISFDRDRVAPRPFAFKIPRQDRSIDLGATYSCCSGERVMQRITIRIGCDDPRNEIAWRAGRNQVTCGVRHHDEAIELREDLDVRRFVRKSFPGPLSEDQSTAAVAGILGSLRSFAGGGSICHLSGSRLLL